MDIVCFGGYVVNVGVYGVFVEFVLDELWIWNLWIMIGFVNVNIVWMFMKFVVEGCIDLSGFVSYCFVFDDI